MEDCGQLRSHDGRIRVTNGRTGAVRALRDGSGRAAGGSGGRPAGPYRPSAARIASSIPGYRKTNPDSNSRAGRTR